MSDNDTDTDRQSEQDPFEEPSAEQDQQVQSETRAETAESTLDMQPARRTAVSNQTDGIAETFEKQSIVNQIKSTIVLFFAVGVGAGIAGFAIVGTEIEGVQVGNALLAPAIVTLALIGPVLAAFVGTRMGTALSEEPEIQTYTAAGISTFAGHILFFLIAFILTEASVSSGQQTLSVGDFFLPAIVSAIGTALVGIVTAYGALTLIADS